jgi:hypothetical protein
MIRLDSGPTFRQLLGQDAATSQLLKPESADCHEPTTMHSSSSQPYVDDESELSQLSLPADERLPQHKYKRLDTVDITTRDFDSSTHVLWNGNPVYALSWDLLGVVISILFLSTCSIRHSLT